MILVAGNNCGEPVQFPGQGIPCSGGVPLAQEPASVRCSTDVLVKLAAEPEPAPSTAPLKSVHLPAKPYWSGATIEYKPRKLLGSLLVSNQLN